jgi:hypothetical protein
VILATALGHFGPVVGREDLDGALGVGTVGCVADLGQRLAGARLHGLGQAAEHVGELVDLVTLVAGGREDIAERRPQPQRAVTDRDDRGLHATPP